MRRIGDENEEQRLTPGRERESELVRGSLVIDEKVYQKRRVVSASQDEDETDQLLEAHQCLPAEGLPRSGGNQTKGGESASPSCRC